VNYTPERLREVFNNDLKKAHGTRLHAFAQEAIELNQKQPKSGRTLNNYINDAIGFRMSAEKVLYYSDDIFGTPDAIGFKETHPDHPKGILRIFDLKTGDNPAKMTQLEVYAALFCLEYEKDPAEISIDLRIYQTDKVETLAPEPSNIQFIMDKIEDFADLIEQFREEYVA
jgi:hypothetical protein